MSLYLLEAFLGWTKAVRQLKLCGDMYALPDVSVRY